MKHFVIHSDNPLRVYSDKELLVAECPNESMAKFVCGMMNDADVLSEAFNTIYNDKCVKDAVERVEYAGYP